MNKRKIEEEIFQQNKFEKLNNIADSEEDDDDSVDENNYDVMQEQDIEGNFLLHCGLCTKYNIQWCIAMCNFYTFKVEYNFESFNFGTCCIIYYQLYYHSL